MAKADEATVAVMRELRSFRDGIDEMMAALGEKRSLSRGEVEDLQALFKPFKERLRVAAKRHPRNKVEQAYFQPAVSNASANLLIATNTHPIKSNWRSALYGIRIDITFYLSQLERQFPDVASN